MKASLIMTVHSSQKQSCPRVCRWPVKVDLSVKESSNNECRDRSFFISLAKYQIQLERMKISSHYKGKEQSFIKHKLLETYLERLFMIIGQHESRIRYVDCFAGPWNTESDDLRDTSIAISLGLMKTCQKNLEKQGKNVRFQALFIEKSIESYKKLDSFLQTESTEEVSADSLHGDFYSLRYDILEWSGNDDFTFFFIDPKGWNLRLRFVVKNLAEMAPFSGRDHVISDTYPG